MYEKFNCFNILLGFSVVNNVWSEDREKYLSYIEAAGGLGLMLGPVIGGILNTYFSYSVTFFTFAALCAVSGVLSLLFIPSSLNNRVEQKNS
jgi:MFS family permease